MDNNEKQPKKWTLKFAEYNIDKTKFFMEDKSRKENISEMFRIVTDEYSNEECKNEEILVIFGRKPKPSSNIYETTYGSYESVILDGLSEKETYDEVSKCVISMKEKYLNAFLERGLRIQESDFRVAFFHNHRQGTPFSTKDFISLLNMFAKLKIAGDSEMYIDTTDLIFCKKMQGLIIDNDNDFENIVYKIKNIFDKSMECTISNAKKGNIEEKYKSKDYDSKSIRKLSESEVLTSVLSYPQDILEMQEVSDDVKKAALNKLFQDDEDIIILYWPYFLKIIHEKLKTAELFKILIIDKVEKTN